MPVVNVNATDRSRQLFTSGGLLAFAGIQSWCIFQVLRRIAYLLPVIESEMRRSDHTFAFQPQGFRVVLLWLIENPWLLSLLPPLATVCILSVADGRTVWLATLLAMCTPLIAVMLVVLL